ncbi:MAG: thiamine-phosphate kinase [Deltaproteobacteria bacterium]|nr:thiamine-phosphate kinase [Deltaproteobacteria bacterium]
MTDEFARIAEIKRRLSGGGDQVRIGIGDDAAVLAPSDASQVLSVDVQVEEVHFRREFIEMNDLGYRSLVVALSDLAAMGAEPRAALISLILPNALSDDQLFALTDGISEAATRYRSPVVGGNLSRGSQLSITTTVVGRVEERVLTRRGARPGDRVYLTAAIGRAALGLEYLQKERAAQAVEFVQRWRRPKARIAEGRALLGLASAAIDISDGLLQDLGHLCQASRVNAEIELEALPVDPRFRLLAEALALDPIALMLTAGEDYELVFTAPADVPIPETYIRIGRVYEGAGLVELRDREGRYLSFDASGYRHW